MCGNDSGFSPSSGQIKQSRARKFCSTTCALKFRHRDKIILSICPHCKKEFRKYPDGKAVRKYCSMNCYNKIRGVNLPSYDYPIKEKKRYKMKKIKGTQMYLHRWVMEQYLGRKLTRKEVVHHINGDPHDNRIENLQLMTQSEHMKLEIRQWKENSN